MDIIVTTRVEKVSIPNLDLTEGEAVVLQDILQNFFLNDEIRCMYYKYPTLHSLYMALTNTEDF